ncbi:putative dolichyl-phosphate-mannose--protein mannosyltransferase [Saccharomyces eubayanus]|uniref:putative dolichyl-phosphate-mannose--protein mannosyltransferase n=1 Tax=Saccharomyces eubayanus TaxID=1080349 RepID=UPI0006C202BC|nr:PMT7-like protein [Saccharomyces eubayanus]KOH01133.1 PMT7-like protein [Saccharomyces eubayanus]
MSKQKKRNSQNMVDPRLQGPFRKYLPYNIFEECHIGHLTTLDYIFAFLVVVANFTFVWKSHPSSFWARPWDNDTEQELFGYIRFYLDKAFYIHELPPFTVQLYSTIERLDITQNLRCVSLFLNSSTLAFLFLVLRRIDCSFIISTVGLLTLSNWGTFRKEGTILSSDNLEWCLFSIILYTSITMSRMKLGTAKWFAHLITLSISLGLAISSKFIGFLTWGFIILSLVRQFDKLISDVDITAFQIVRFIVFNLLFIFIVPTSIFTLSYWNLLSNFNVDVPEYSKYMTTSFKSYLRGSQLQPTRLYYGSTITLRHLDSMAGYLTSHEIPYPSDIQENLVSLSFEEFNADNEWVVEHPTLKLNFSEIHRIGQLIPLEFDHDIKLRHKSTGKLLRASTAKPPISEQDYDLRISCTKDSEYEGGMDERWNVLLVKDSTNDNNNSSSDDKYVKPLRSEVQLRNKGQRCGLLSHDLRLPEWGYFEQEVLCMENPVMSRTSFLIDSVRLAVDFPIPTMKYYMNEINSSTEDSRTLSLKQFVGLLKEYIFKQYKYNYYVRYGKSKANFEDSLVVEKWPITLDAGSPVWFKLAWYGSILAMIVFLCVQCNRIVHWNPWSTTETVFSINWDIYNEFGWECTVGWFLHYYVFTMSPHFNLESKLYFQSFIFSELCLLESLNVLAKSHKTIFSIMILLLITSIVLMYK